MAALCYLKRTAIAKPRIVALLPSSPDYPGLSGFHVIYLPFRNEIREFDYEQLTARIYQGEAESKLYRATRDQIEAAKSIVKKLKGIYDPENFEEPTLHTWWKCIENSALKNEDFEPVEDCTLPNYDWIAKRLGPLADAFVSLVYPYGCEPEATPTKPQAEVDPGEVEHAAQVGTVIK